MLLLFILDYLRIDFFQLYYDKAYNEERKVYKKEKFIYLKEFV